MLSITLTPDEAGAKSICELCDGFFVSTAQQPRAWIHREYVGFVCPECAAADPDALLERIRQPLAEARTRLRQLEAVEGWLRSVSPDERQRTFRVVRSSGATCTEGLGALPQS
jgi:hypothetical protein